MLLTTVGVIWAVINGIIDCMIVPFSLRGLRSSDVTFARSLLGKKCVQSISFTSVCTILMSFVLWVSWIISNASRCSRRIVECK